MSDLRDRIAAAIERNLEDQLPSDLPDRYRKWIGYDTLADAVIAELDLGIPCAREGCRMRQIARRSAEKLGLTGDGA